MIPVKNIIPIWQPQGYSTNHLAKSIGELYDVKGTHTGTLDPMAEGIVVVLLGDSRLKRDELSSSVKGYEFEVAFGISTDSFDGLGFVQKDVLSDALVITLDNLQNTCNEFLGHYEQTVPIFSAQLHQGKKLFEWGHANADIKLPKKEGTIYKFDVLEVRTTSLKEAISQVIHNVKNIRGNFRQQEVVSQWETHLKSAFTNSKITIAKFYVETSRGLYVRSLSQDLCAKLGTVGFICSLTRVKNGKYAKNDCQVLGDLFGKNYANILKLPC